MTLDTMIDAAAKIAQKTFRKKGAIPPTWLVQRGDGERAVLVTPWESPTEKMFAVEGLRRLFAEMGVVRYCAIWECWESANASTRPSEDPERQEVILLSAEDAFDTRLAMFRILRPERGKPKLSALDKLKDGGAGRMSGLLHQYKH